MNTVTATMNTTRPKRRTTVQGDGVVGVAGRVYTEQGSVKMELYSDTMTIEEAKNLTMKMVELEYSLP